MGEPPHTDIPPALIARADDPAYREQARAEEEFWRRVHPGGLESTELRHAPGPLDRFLNQRFTGDERLHWSQSLARHGRFATGAFLGTSAIALEARILETNPGLHLTFYDIAEGGLARRRELLGPRFPGRVATQVADLNFVEFAPERYDVIISSSTMHHVTNLEHLAFQINRALTPHGLFFIEDYVGEPRFQFAPVKRQVYLELFNRDRARRGEARSALAWLDTSDLSPFCGVRSDEILSVCATYLDAVDVRTAGALTVAMSRSHALSDAVDSPWVSDMWSVRNRWRFLVAVLRQRLSGRSASPQTMIPEAFWHELHVVGDVLSGAGLVQPGLAFGCYRKRRTPGSTAQGTTAQGT